MEVRQEQRPVISSRVTRALTNPSPRPSPGGRGRSSGVTCPYTFFAEWTVFDVSGKVQPPVPSRCGKTWENTLGDGRVSVGVAQLSPRVRSCREPTVRLP